MSYDAFLSYSHGASQRLAAAIELTLEGLGKRWDERRALMVFRDVSKQSVTSDLAGDLLARLDASRFFILLASPEAARSPWVAQEVRHWLNTKGIGKLLLALIGGDLVWDSGAGRFDAARTTALPDLLRDAYAAEPKWVDFRWALGEEGLGIGHERFADCVADLSAAIQGRSKDEVVGAQLREHGKAVARQVAQHASTLVGYQPDLALLLAAAATDLSSNADTRRALLGVLESTADIAAVLGVGGRVTSFALDGTGTTLLAGLQDGTIEEWDPTTGTRLREIGLAHEGAVTALAFNLHGSAFAAGFADGVITVVTRDGRVLGTVRAGGRPQLVALDNRAAFVAAAAQPPDRSLTTVELWGLDSRTHVAPYSEEYGTLEHLCFDWQGRSLRVFESSMAITFDAFGGAEVHRCGLPLPPRPGPKSFTPDGRICVHTSFDSGWVDFFNTEEQQSAEDELLGEVYKGVTDGVAVSPGVDAAAVVANRRLTVMYTGGGRPAVECLGMPPHPVNIGLTPGGRAVVVLGSGRAQLHWPGRKSRLGTTLLTEVQLPSVIRGVGDAAFSPDGRFLAWVANPGTWAGEGRAGRRPDETVAVWDCKECLWAASVAAADAYQVAFSGNHCLVVISMEGEVSAWDVKSGSRTQSLARVPSEAITDGRVRLWCPSGDMPVLIVHRGATTAIYGALDTRSEPIWSRPPQGAGKLTEVTTSRSTRFALCDAGGAVEVWDIRGTLVYTTKVSDPYAAHLNLSDDGRLLAVAEAGGDIVVHDVDAATVRADMAVGDAASVAISADARSMFVLASDGRITLYDLPGGFIAGTLQGFPGTTWGLVRAGPDPRWLAELAAGGALTLWDVSPESWRATARRVAGRELTESEKARFHLNERIMS
jgi:WD40 repeat protein